MNVQLYNKTKYLITTDAWFFAPDGKQYRSVWGEVELFEDKVLQIKTNIKSTNWYAKVGSDRNHVIVAGCQIHYAARCEDKPYIGNITETTFETGQLHTFQRPTQIYIAE